MALGFKIEGGAGNVANVTAAGNLNVVLPLALNNDAIIGAACIAGNNDSGSVTGAQEIQYPFVSPDFRLSAGVDTPLANHTFSSTSQDTGRWKHLFTTMTAAQASGFLTLNNNLTGTTATGCSMSTWQVFPLQTDGALFVQMTAAFTNSATLQLNQQFNFGWFAVSSVTTETTDGVYFRVTSTGFEGVCRNNNTPVAIALSFTPALNQQYKFAIIMESHNCSFWINDILYGRIEAPTAVGLVTASVALPLSYHFFNVGTVTGIQAQARITNDSVTQTDTSWGFSAVQLLNTQGMGGWQGQDGGTQGSTANYANNAAPTAAVPNNTTALVTGLGGQAYSTNTLAINTDGIIFSYQVPAGGVTQVPRQLIIHGVVVDSAVQTTLANAGGAVYQWSLAVGHTAVSLATTESASFANNTAKAPRRIALGHQTAIGALAQGSALQRLVRDLDCPIVVNPGEFIAVVMKNGGTVGTAGTLSHHVAFDHAWR